MSRLINETACAPSEDLDQPRAWASAQSDQSSLCTQWVAKDPSFLLADSEDSDQTEFSLGAHAILLVLSWGGWVM